MSETMTTETPAAETPAAPLSIAEHAAKFKPGSAADVAPAAEPAPTTESESEPEPADPLNPVRPVDRQRRSDSGQFAEGQKRLKAKDAVGRINELTARAKTAEERLALAEAELTQLRQQGAPRAEVQRAEQKVERAEQQAEAEPKEDDPKYGGDYAKYLLDHARWAARDEWHQQQRQQAQRIVMARKEQQHFEVLKGFDERVQAARAKYADFDQVAFETPTTIPPGSLADAWIMEHASGPDVLYFLQSHPDELDALLRMPVLGQAERLSLLAQRFASPTAGSTGGTGSVAPRPVVLPPKPLNPVRTEAQRAEHAPTAMDGSLSVTAHAKKWHKR